MITPTQTPPAVEGRGREAVPSPAPIPGGGTANPLSIDPAVYALGAAQVDLLILCTSSLPGVRARAGETAMRSIEVAEQLLSDLKAATRRHLDAARGAQSSAGTR